MDVDSGLASCRLRVGPIQEDNLNNKQNVRFEDYKSVQRIRNRNGKSKNADRRNKKDSDKENIKHNRFERDQDIFDVKK